MFEWMTTTKRSAGLMLFCVLVTAVALATGGDEDQIPRSLNPALSDQAVSNAAARVELQSPAGPTPREAAGDAVTEFLTSRYQDAVRSYENGNFEKAWRICEALMVLAPDNFPLRLDVRKLRRRAHGRHLSHSVFVVRFERDEAESAFPLSLLEGSVVLENLSQEKILFGDQEQNPVLGQVAWSVHEVYQNGTVRSLSDVRVLRIESGFQVEAGASRAIPVTLPLPVPGAMPVLQQWAVTGVTMPVRLVTAEGEVSRGIPWLEETGLVVPDGYQSIENDPKGELRKSLLDGDPIRMAISQYLWLKQRRDSKRSPNPLDPIVDDLLASLGSHRGVLDGLIVMSLEEVTGLIRERSARAWKIWGVTRQVRRGSDKLKD
ncbi:MAG TPA: hypothetical protein EYQ08_05575 [Planctomycetes bacterium]|nr:hypothetical protein [Planctomycetota bacterium]HIK82185.1 hypothetical protein [Planctomycetota bacterium]